MEFFKMCMGESFPFPYEIPYEKLSKKSFFQIV